MSTLSSPMRLVAPRRLDAVVVGTVRRALAAARAPALVHLDLSWVVEVEPVGAALLLLLCREAETAAGGGVLRVTAGPRVRRLLRRHPLRAHLADGESLFGEPFEPPRPSGR